MASRFTDIKPLERCFSPIRVLRNGEWSTFPCGRCPACLLDKANGLSMRLVDEIEYTPYSIFFTLTYSNKYLPKLYRCHDSDINPIPFYYSNHFNNVRFDGVQDVRRQDNIFLIHYNSLHFQIKSFNRSDVFGYCSKRDIILWFKLLRKDIDDTFNLKEKDDKEKERYRFRYFIISEYGPTTYRPHYHGLLFARDPEVAEYLLRVSMYKNWKMCDKTLFDQYTHFADGGAAGYVTNYLNCSSDLPDVFEDKQIRTFRLSSKAPAIGFGSFVVQEVFENLYQGINEYTKTVKRCEASYIFPYPSDFMHRLFPKCREYRLLSYSRLRYLYGFLFRNVIKRGFSYDFCNSFIRSRWFASDVTASQKCYKACKDYGLDVDTYLMLLDMYYYKESMIALRKFYEWQQDNFDKPVTIAYSYSNFLERVHCFSTSSVEKQNTLVLFSSSLGFDIYDFVSKPFVDLSFTDPLKDSFQLQVSDIVQGMKKMPKFNELGGFAPHII